MSNAIVSRTLRYNTTGNQPRTETPIAVTAQYALGAQVDAGIDIPQNEAADTEHEVSFGGVDGATYFELHNQTGQAMRVHLNQFWLEGTLDAGELTLSGNIPVAMDGEAISVKVLTPGGTPGKLSVERDGIDIVVTSYNGSGIENLDTSMIRVVITYPLVLSDGGFVMCAMPTLPDPGALQSVHVSTTTLQSAADGRVGYKLFGDPT